MSISLERAFITLKDKLPEYVEKHRELKPVGNNYKLSCLNPAHEDKNPSCYLLAPAVVHGKDLQWKFYCHGCGVGGDIFNAAALLENKPLVGHEFLEDNVLHLAKEFELGEVRTKQLTEREIFELSMYKCMRDAVDVLNDITPKQRLHINKYVREYIYEHDWVIEDDTKGEMSTDCSDLNSMGIFWLSKGETFRQLMKSLGYTEKFLEQMDMWLRGGKRHPIFNRNNLIVTVYDEKGRPVGFSGRNCNRSEGESKYVNTMASLEGSIYHKGRLLYNLHNARSVKGPTYVVEGYTDVITMRMNGFHNCVAMCGTMLTADQMLSLRAAGITNIVLVLDGDKAGQDKITKILDERISGQTDIRCKVVLLPEGYDPDEYVREYGLDEFFKLRPMDAFEYRLELIQGEGLDPEDVCRVMIPLIANEPSGIAQESMAKKLGQFTGFSLQSILKDVAVAINLADAEREREKEAVLAEAMLKAKDDWDAAPMVLISAANRIAVIDQATKSDLMSISEFARAIDEQMQLEEERTDEQAGYRLGPHLSWLDHHLAGEWEGSMTILGGRANTGKTTLMTEVALFAALEQEDVVSVLLTLDDARNKIIPRLVCLLAYQEFSSNYLTMNMVKHPAYWRQQMGGEAIDDFRSFGYDKLKQLVNSGQLIVKDTVHGTSFPYISALMQHHVHANPDKQVLFFLDNFHKVSATGEGARDREFNVDLALNLKNLAKQLSIPVWMIAEYHKLQPGTRPNNNHLAETVKLEYEADVIIHLYNDLHDLGIESRHFFNYDGKKMPIVEGIFGKNKINDFKDSVWMKFYPEFGRHETVTREEVDALVKQQPIELEDDDD